MGTLLSAAASGPALPLARRAGDPPREPLANPRVPQPPHAPSPSPHLGVEHVDAEVAEGGLEEVLLGAVLEQGTVHGAGAHLEKTTEGRSFFPSSFPAELFGDGVPLHRRWRAGGGEDGTDLLVDLQGFLVLLQLGRVGGHLQQTLVGRAAGNGEPGKLRVGKPRKYPPPRRAAATPTPRTGVPRGEKPGGKAQEGGKPPKMGVW